MKVRRYRDMTEFDNNLPLYINMQFPWK